MKTIYIVRRTGGGHDDYYETDLVAYTSEDKAKEHVDKLNEQLLEYLARERELEFHRDWVAPTIPASVKYEYWFQDEELKAEWQKKYDAYNKKWNELRASIMTLDPKGGYDDDNYDYITLDLIED